MQILSTQIYSGKNIYSHRSVIKMIIDFGNLYEKPTKDIAGFNDELLNLFPGLYKHFCSLGYEGGFADRLREGTYIGHVLEHLILELQGMMGYQVFYGKTRKIKEPGLYYIVFEYVNESCALECGRTAVNIILDIIARREINLTALLKNLSKVTVESELGPTTKAIFEEAKKRDIPVTRVGVESLLQLGYGKYTRFIEASLSDAPSCISVDIAGNKHLTKHILMENKIPVPPGDIAYTAESAVAIADGIGYPVVIKPYNSNQGKGVTLDIRNREQIGNAFNEAVKHSKAAVVEKCVRGKDYRVLVVGGAVSAVSERRPPIVTGDGIHTIGELVEIENRNPLRGQDHEKPLTKIKLDNVSKQILMKNGIDEFYIPYKGEVLRLRENGNLSTGGTARDCTAEIHPFNSLIAVKVAKALNLDIAGIDIIVEDISEPINYLNGAVIEINAAPGLRMHLYPTEGEARDVAADIVDMMFPKEQSNSIPIVSITGTNGKTTTTRLIRHALTIMGMNVGMTSTSGIYVGNECIMKGDNTGPLSAKMVLSNKKVEAAVLETARGGIVRRGLGYDLADVGLIVNISEDHIGMDGVDTLEDLAFAKSLVIEAIKPQGYAILNADDAMFEYLKKRVVSNLIIFSKNRDNEFLKKHMEEAGKAVYLDNNRICVFDGRNEKPLVEVEDIPITFGGMAQCNIENSLAAVSALYALNISSNIIIMGLKTFKPDAVSNPGRFNIFDMGDFKVMLDYGHNPAGYNAVIRLAQNINVGRLVGIIGVPGDRLNKNIMEVGEICGKVFNKIYIKEDNDLRGRNAGEVAEILYDSAIKGGIKKENVGVIYSELKALETAMLDAQPGDLIIMLYEEFETAIELINKFKQELERSIICSDMAIEESAG